MFLKVCGAIITVAGTFLYSCHLTMGISQRIKRLTSFKESLMLMSGHIGYARLSMPELVKSIAESISHTEIKALYGCVYERLNDNKGDAFLTIWQESVKKGLGVSPDDAECRMFCEIGELPLYMDATMQVKFLEEKINSLEAEIGREKAELDKKERVYKSLGLSAGVLIVLVLI